MVIENSDLQGQLFKLKQEHEKELQDFKRKTRKNELKLADLEFMHRVTSDRVKELITKNKILTLALKNSGSIGAGISFVSTNLKKISITLK